MSYQFYKWLHIFGISTLLLSFGSLIAASRLAAEQSVEGLRFKKMASIAHGVALVLILVAGFGLLARLGLAREGLPGWAIVKLVVWLALGAMLPLIKRGKLQPKVSFGLSFGLVILAAYFAIYKPIA